MTFQNVDKTGNILHLVPTDTVNEDRQPIALNSFGFRLDRNSLGGSQKFTTVKAKSRAWDWSSANHD